MIKPVGGSRYKFTSLILGGVVIDKACSSCGEVKPADQFKPRIDRPSGLRSRCRACDGRAERARYAEARAAAGPARRPTRRRRIAVEPTLANFEGVALPDPEPERPKITISAPVAPPEPEFNPHTGLDRLGRLKIRRAP
jgi:hypothetical protein